MALKNNKQISRWRQNPILNMLWYTWKYSAGHRHMFYGFIILSICGNLIGLLEPIAIGRIFNTVQTSLGENEIIRALLINLFLLLAINFGFWLFHGPSRIIEERNAFMVRRSYRNDMFRKVMDLRPEWHDNHHSGDTIDKIEKASGGLYGFSASLFQVLQNTTNLIGAFIILSIFDWRATLGALAISLIAIFSILKFDVKLRQGYKKIFKAENYLSAGIFDYLSNIITVITLRLRKKAAHEIDRRSMKAYPAVQRNTILSEIKWFSTNMYIILMTVGVLFLNAYTTVKGGGIIMIGTLYILYDYLNKIGDTFYNFAWKYGEIVRQDTALRAAEIITEDYNKLPPAKKYSLPENWRIIKIKNLNFRYRGVPKKSDDEKIRKASSITDVSITVPRNKKIALIGESGSGKSTIFSLLRGLYRPGGVQVFCDGSRLKNELKHLYGKVTLIPQEPEIFDASVEYNITVGNETPKSETYEAARIARFDAVVARLKNGYKTNVMEKGVSLSGGEKQRLAFARGLLAARESDILLLDEPTSSVDSDNEIKIYRNIFLNYKDKTIIASMHRLYLLKYFDYIYLFRDGRVLSEGTFKTLLDDTHFKKLWDVFMQQEKEEKKEKEI